MTPAWQLAAGLALLIGIPALFAVIELAHVARLRRAAERQRSSGT